MSNQAKRLSDCPAERLAHCRGEAVPPAGDVEAQDSAKMEFDKLAHAHVLAICRGAAAACTEQHSYMQGAKTDSKHWFPHKWVIDAIRNLVGINQSTCLTLRDDTTRLQAEASALQQRLNIADQKINDLEHAQGQCLEVNPTSLRALLVAVTGAPHEIREIQACRGIPDNPIDQLLREYNDWVYAPAPPAGKLDASMIGIVHTPPMEYDEP